MSPTADYNRLARELTFVASVALRVDTVSSVGETPVTGDDGTQQARDRQMPVIRSGGDDADEL